MIRLDIMDGWTVDALWAAPRVSWGSPHIWSEAQVPFPGEVKNCANLRKSRIRNCPHCRLHPGDRSCRAREEARKGVAVLHREARWILVRAGLSSPRHRRPPQHRCRRQRMPQEGMLLQLDGSHHLWLEDRGPWLTLLLAVDDATGTAPHALFQEQEDTRGYLSLLQGIIERQGVPMAVYTDGHAVFQPRRNTSDLSQVPRKGPSTQWGRALGELGITQILAHSP